MNTIVLDAEMLNAVLTAVGGKAWDCRGTLAGETYDRVYKEISRQAKENRV